MERRAAIDLLRAESSTWALEPSALEGVLALVARDDRPALSRPQAPPAGGSSVAVVPIIGPLMRRGGFLSDLLGFANYPAIRQAIGAAAASSAVSKIVLLVDSPGGAAMGCEEAAADIKRAARSKPVTAFVDGLAGSAALWLASQANSIISTPSGEIGSIGAFLLHVEMSRALDKAGITPTLIHNRTSPFKAEGNPFEPLAKDSREYLQDEVDAIADKFITGVASGRGVSPAHVKAEYGKGRMLRAEIAKAKGLIDGIGSMQFAVSAPADRTKLMALEPAAVRRFLELERNR
jgi:signal peptide peptidase SppA